MARTKGAIGRLNRDMKEVIFHAFEKAGGSAYLVKQAHSEPKAFLSLLGRIVPNEVRLDANIAILDLGKAMEQNQLNLDRLQVIEGNVIATDDTPIHESPAKSLITKDNAK